MLRKLLPSIFQSTMQAPPLPESPPAESLPWPPPELESRDDVDTTMSSSWLPTDVLLEIFLRLEEASDVIRCACVCKPWRRAIIGNAASLRPDDGFDPRLLLGVFQSSSYQTRLWRALGPFQSALPSNGVGRLGGYETARCLMPDSAAGDRALYRELLWSADGFILLMARTLNRLCLFNPVTGDCTFLPAAAASKCCAYVLLTGDDDVRILAVQKRRRFMFSKAAAEKEEEERGLWYQVLCTSGAGAGEWGPVQRSCSGGGGDDVEGGGLCVWMEPRGTVVCRDDVVHWLAGPSARSITCVLALDVRTGRTWTTALPQLHGRRRLYRCRASPDSSVPILATSGDGRLSLMESLGGPRINVWVMLDDDDDGWTLQQTVAVDLSSVVPPQWLDDEIIMPFIRQPLSLGAFCPRSGCVVAVCCGMELLIDIQSGGCATSRIGKRRGHDCCPYEMDSSSTYISKMKHF